MAVRRASTTRVFLEAENVNQYANVKNILKNRKEMILKLIKVAINH